MSEPEGPAAPESGNEIPTFEELAEDHEIAALLGFEPVVRKVVRGNAWTAEAQRMFVAYVAHLGSRTKAATIIGKEVAGASKLCRAEGGEGFRDSCDAALELYQQRSQARALENRGGAWGEPLRARGRSERLQGADAPSPRPSPARGEGEFGEDGDPEWRRAEELRDSITNKLLRSRRMYLFEIADSPGHRAAFEILTELPIDWDKARNMEAQPDEPWRSPSMRKPDMLLTAENGWLGDIVHGRDKKGELRQMLNEHLIAEGKEPVDWDSEEEGDEK